MTSHALLPTVAFLFVLCGCSTSEAIRGTHAEKAKDYVAARDAYRRELDIALGESRIMPVSRVRILLTTYELGRMIGYTCDYAEAETLLRETLRLSELMEERFAHRTAILSELARLTYDQGKLADSASFYEREIERLGRFQHVDRDPIGLANFVNDYAIVIERTGNVEVATQVQVRSDSILMNTAGRPALFTPLHYRDVCGDKYR